MKRVEQRRAAALAAVVVCALGASSVACDAGKASPADRGETVSPQPTLDKDNGGTGVRAKGEEGSMGNPQTAPRAGAPAIDLGAMPARPTASATVGVLAAPPPPADIPSPVPTAHLDPNARYATTYRPGGAALAAFDSAVARGQIPATYKDLVGDFGARYAPATAAPADGALAVSVDTERTAVGPGGGPLNLRVALVSSDRAPPRAPLSVHIVLDTSGSMSGPAIHDAREAAKAVVEKLAPGDDFSMVTFSDSAHLLIPDGPLGPRRAQALERIRQVQADGGTNISSGLDLAYAQAHSAGIPADAVRIVMLLSDGHANGGDTDPQRLAQRAATAFQEGVQTSAFGLGGDFDAALMSRIADRGAGGYYYLADSSQIAPALARDRRPAPARRDGGRGARAPAERRRGDQGVRLARALLGRGRRRPRPGGRHRPAREEARHRQRPRPRLRGRVASSSPPSRAPTATRPSSPWRCRRARASAASRASRSATRTACSTRTSPAAP